MGCSRACDEGHTYRAGCAMQATTAEAPAINLQRPVARHIDRCANLLCPNQAHEGQFALALPHNRHPVALPLCAPCAETIMGRIR